MIMDEDYSIDDRISDDLCALKMHLEDHVKYKKDPKKSFYANKIKEKEFHKVINFQKKITLLRISLNRWREFSIQNLIR